MERYELRGMTVYQLNICEASGDHHLCPGITRLRAADLDLGSFAWDCPCHKKPEKTNHTNENGGNICKANSRPIGATF
jgi:hypothetical protein